MSSPIFRAWLGGDTGGTACNESAFRVKRGKQPRQHRYVYLLVINISSIQLIPVNIIAYRSQYGSVNPTAIVAPAILATTVSTLAAIVFCKIMAGKSA